MRKIAFRYGNRTIDLHIPERNLAGEIRMGDVAPANDCMAAIEAAMQSPISSVPLEELALGKHRVVVVVDDMTRPTPVHLLLPSILGRLLRSGTSPDSISILVATGTHRPMTPAELEARLGPAACGSFRVINHDYRNADGLVDLGTTPSGIPVVINRMVAEADLVIGVGNIVPHRYCGWSGGAKIIQPGVCGEATTASTHLMITKDPDARLGVAENRVRHEMEAVAESAHLRFIVNTILDRHGRIIGVVAGDFRQAFRAGVERARAVYNAPFAERADVIVASAYPSDINLWQAGKAFYSSDLAVRDGGIIILASPLYEGVGEHTAIVDLFQRDYADLEGLIAAHQVQDRVGAAAALAVALIRQRASIWLTAHTISTEDARRMHMRRFDSVQAAIDAALHERGPAIRIAVMHEATEALPALA